MKPGSSPAGPADPRAAEGGAGRPLSNRPSRRAGRPVPLLPELAEAWSYARGAGPHPDAGDVPLLRVSTCFVSGRREGIVPERVLPLAASAHGRGELDLSTLLAELEERCRGIHEQHAEGAGVEGPLVEAGAEQAERHGFHDVYTLTKALGELVLVRDQGAVPLTIVRPAIVESAVEKPMAGWIDAVRVADPLLGAYGRARVSALPSAQTRPGSGRCRVP